MEATLYFSSKLSICIELVVLTQRARGPLKDRLTIGSQWLLPRKMRTHSPVSRLNTRILPSAALREGARVGEMCE